MARKVEDAVLARLKAAVGERGWTQDVERMAPHLVEWRDRWRGETPLLLMPASTEEVARIVTICAQTATPLVPQGGNTGLVAGQIPMGEVLLSLQRMTAVREVSAVDDVLICEAGCTLSAVHEAALSAGRMFPLSLASEGSATIGGLVSTNAGGVAVLRYGVMRDLVLGLEAVLPSGEIWRGLKRLRKDNTGYDLKQLLIGAEGTLGVVTAASLKLFPVLRSRATAVVGLASPQAAVELLARCKDAAGPGVEAFELMSRFGVDLALKNIPGQRDPLGQVHSWYVLVEIATAQPGSARGLLEEVLADGLECGLVADAALAQDETQARAFWSLRENQSAAQKREGATWKHDVSVPIRQVPVFLEQAAVLMAAFAPGARISAFGHLGDGNIHYDVLRPLAGEDASHAARREEGSRIIHDLVAELGGSISAEHGLGAAKTAQALAYKSEVELAALSAVRRALDPGRILNPRVLF